jgi:hypothetical protein
MNILQGYTIVWPSIDDGSEWHCCNCLFCGHKGLDLLVLLPDRGCQTASIIINKVEIVWVYDGI